VVYLLQVSDQNFKCSLSQSSVSHWFNDSVSNEETVELVTMLHLFGFLLLSLDQNNILAPTIISSMLVFLVNTKQQVDSTHKLQMRVSHLKILQRKPECPAYSVRHFDLNMMPLFN
jgi:hypothetical protein